MQMFSNREIATAVWVFVFAIWAMVKVPNMGQLLSSVLKQALNPKLVLPFVFLGLYVSSIVAILYWADVWTIILLKDTVIWFIFVALPLSFTLATSKTGNNLLKSVISQSISGFIFFEYLTATYNFSLLIEFILIPVATFLVLLVTVSERDKQYAIIHNILIKLQALLGLVILGFAIAAAWADAGNLWQFSTLLSFLLAPILSVLLIPYIYFLSIYSGYEQLFIPLNIGTKRDKEVISYAKVRLFRHLGIDRHKVLRFLQKYNSNLIRIRSKSDIDQLIEQEFT